MKKFTLSMRCEGAAFDDNPGYEIARILEILANRVKKSPLAIDAEFTLSDHYGNTVGEASIESD